MCLNERHQTKFGMMKDREEEGAPQLDLFAWSGRDGGVAGPADKDGTEVLEAEQPGVAEPEDIAAMAPAAIHHALEVQLGATSAAPGTVLRLIAEVARRGDRAAAPLLVKLCRRHAGFDRSRTVPEVAMALEALAAIGAADAAPLILQLVEQDALGPSSTAAALRYFTAVRHRPAVCLLIPCLEHAVPDVRAAACALAAAIENRDSTDFLVKLLTDFHPAVADAALLALGHLGHRPIKNALEDRLHAARAEEIVKIVEALVAVADEETAVTLGRVAERTADDSARVVVTEALAEPETPTAATWLERLADDPSPTVRRAVAAGLAAYGEAQARKPAPALKGAPRGSTVRDGR